MKPFSFSSPDTFSRSVVISASAGSGKTFTLSVLVLLAFGRMEARPFEVCAATFSEAAAADLRERLLRPLDLLNSFDLDTWGEILPLGPNCSEICNSLNIASGELVETFDALRQSGPHPWMDTPLAAQSFWRRTRREAELMNVSTLHSLALGLLRTGDGAPDRILEADHPALLRILRLAVRETTDVAEDDPDYLAAYELLKWAERHWDSISFGHDAHRDALGLYGDLSTEKVRAELKNALGLARKAIEPFSNNPELAKDAASRTRRYFDPKKILPIPNPSSPLSDQLRWAERQSAAMDAESDALPGYYAPAFVNAIQTLAAVASAWEAWLCQILAKSLMRFEELKQGRRVATFGDIVRSALEGLNGGSIAPPRPKLLLVDEYQDTSMAQDAFLDALGAERVVRVGDVKQAIYGFRGGTSDLLKNHIGYAGDSAFRLAFNFRSAPPIVDMSNKFVNAVWPSIDPSMERSGAEQTPKAIGTCPVGAALVNSSARGADLPALSEWIIALSQESGWEISFGNDGTDSATSQRPTRAMLLRQRTRLPDLLRHLKRKGVQPYVLTRDGFWDSPGVRLTMAALEALAHPNRPLPCAILLRHFVGLGDNELNLLMNQLGKFRGFDSLDIEAVPREKRHQLTLLQGLKSASTQQIAAHLLAQSNLLAIIASLEAHGAMEPERARRNLAGFLAMLQGLPSNPSTAYAILDELRMGPARGDSPSVSQDADIIIQTVHGSKGLEYDEVILPLLENRRQGIRKGYMLTDPNSKLLLFAWKLSAESGNNYKQIAKLVELQQRRDDLNLFYVAITRAKKRLCLLIQASSTEAKPKANQHYSWAKLGMELQGSHDKLLNLTQPPPIAPCSRPAKPTLEKQARQTALTEVPLGFHAPAPPDGGIAEKLRLRQEGIEMHAYLQNLLVRWEDAEAFGRILNSPPSVANAKENAMRFLGAFESKGWRHLRRRTEIALPDASIGGGKGRADLIVWDQNCIHIIDFKHIHRLTEENEKNYAQQLNRYAKAVPARGILIKGWLALLKSGEWKEVLIESSPNARVC